MFLFPVPIRASKPQLWARIRYGITDTFINWQRFWTSPPVWRAICRLTGKISPIDPMLIQMSS
jgi:hypothetical protein